MKLCLGTVQQGMDYGINNLYGKPSLDTSMEIFRTAEENGIQIFDTARAYGDAELLLGEYFEKYGKTENVKVISKLRPNVFEDEGHYDQVILSECRESLKRLGISKLHGYLLHTPEYIHNPKIVDALVQLKATGLVENIGVSIYELSDGEAAIETGKIDFIQLPFSVFDQRGNTSGFLKRAKDAGITIFTRSAFLQGLLYMEPEHVPEHIAEAKPLLGKLNDILKDSGITKTEALLGFVKNTEYIDYLVFGVDTKNQLQEDINAFTHDRYQTDIDRQLRQAFSNVSKSIIIPSLWSNGKKAE